MKKLLVFLLITIIVSCTPKPPKPSDLYNKYRNSVVLIMNKYYFKVTFDNGMKLYYTVSADKPEIQDDEQAAMKNASISFGTGFIIDKEGRIATNRHVVYPSAEDKLIGDKINDYFTKIRAEIEQQIIDGNNEKTKIANLYNKYYYDLSYSDASTLSDKYHEKDNEILTLQNLLKKLDFNPRNTVIEMVRVNLGIVYDNTFVESEDDFKGCVALQKNDDTDIDLAIIQLKSKRIPEHIKDLIAVSSTNNNPLQLDDDIYMIGYNHGISIGNTQNGLKSQFTQGKITQEPDDRRLLYSIPTLPGSSGSPVLDKWGNLVAINYAKTSDYQGFSFGVSSSHLYDLVNNVPKTYTKPQDTKTPKNDNKSKPTTNNDSKIRADYSDNIRSLLKAEERRDFDLIYSHFSSSMIRYWNINYPSYAEIKEQYRQSWSVTSNAKNYIKDIKRINKFEYILHTDFVYYSNKSNKEINVSSKVKFKFDNNGKIIEVYGL